MGQAFPATSAPQLRRKLSDTMAEVFHLAPEVDSEMVVRRAPSAVVVNARKKVELGLLERYGLEDLGIEGSFADKAIFRCVFLRTGLYRRRGNRWGLADPEDLELPGLAAVWDRIRRFFAEPSKGKCFQSLVNELREPPYGVREGLIPLFLAAGFKAFPTAISLQYQRGFVDDLLPSVVENIARHPSEYTLDVIGLTAQEVEYLRGILRLFDSAQSSKPVEAGDLLRSCMDAVLAWKASLPVAAANSRYVSKEARVLERELRSPDPIGFFLEKLPHLAGVATDQLDELLLRVSRLRDELERIEERLQSEAVQALNHTLTARGIRNGIDVREQARQWASHFPKSFTGNLPDRVSQGVLTRMCSPYRDDASLLNALATLLVGRPIRQWDDAVVSSFRRQLRNAFETIEATALESIQASDSDPELRDGLIAIAEAKATAAALQLSDILGAESAARRLEQMAAELRTDAPNRVV